MRQHSATNANANATNATANGTTTANATQRQRPPPGIRAHSHQAPQRNAERCAHPKPVNKHTIGHSDGTAEPAAESPPHVVADPKPDRTSEPSPLHAADTVPDVRALPPSHGQRVNRHGRVR